MAPINSTAAVLPVNGLIQAQARFASRRQLALRPGLLLAALFVALLVLAALQPGWLVSADPLDASARQAFQAPSSLHWLGTDENGRDILARLVYAVRPSLVLGLSATALGLLLGTVLGLLAGLGPRLVDGAVMRLVDVLLAFPDLLLALVIITFFGQGALNTIIAVGIASVPRYARLVRAQTLVVRNAGYVEAATTLGLPRRQVIWRHVLPNAIKPILILATIGIGSTIVAGAALSFLGFGAPPPEPEWGGMLAIGRNYLANAWWLVAWPALAITLTVVSITAIGRELLRRNEGKRL
ncbi:ABC transporter permease [Pseudomonas wadenswilerensis]|jgi:peptide/nickel transport system permease protein|uniref:Putative D,D-dipeptide transport system permease protein n=1 Tax=Pseudomonas wadenswilerensis TaxID=1785161 RepID=A0A380T144_9PSED|nr:MULTISPECIES: ABC transporter permease [Pseudomonas]MCE5981696.1 ABC transporter permease [Pseudomonas sp. LF19]UVM20070.1 ABC transporter permease [Pseudomonas wadenswilerensis]SUQ63949.1 putative D,D-dipeptide transport system permease protein [Pseudomonas wadenswilerensis]